MNKILVPVDLSSASDWGFYYAYEMAKDFEGELIVVHIYKPHPINTSILSYQKKDILKNQRNSLAKAIKSATEPPLLGKDDPKVSVKYILEPNDGRTIAEIADKHNVELIVMGTHGADGAWDKLWGTRTSKVIRGAQCPVLAIPAGIKYEGIQSVAYATNYDDQDIAMVKRMLSFASMVDAKVHCIHVDVLENPVDEAKEKAFKEAFDETFDELDVTFTSRASTSVEEALETFLRINEISVLGMLTHEKNLWEGLFGISTTRTIALETKVPLLAFHTE